MQEAGSQATNAFTECKFTCTSGQCLYLGSLVCNQQNDCGDNSDEENCLLVTEHPPPGIFSSELEFAQVVVVVVVVTVMVVVIFCLLNHYRASTRSFIHRPGQGQRQEDRPQLEGCLWPSDGSEPRPTSEVRDWRLARCGWQEMNRIGGRVECVNTKTKMCANNLV